MGIASPRGETRANLVPDSGPRPSRRSNSSWSRRAGGAPGNGTPAGALGPEWGCRAPARTRMAARTTIGAGAVQAKTNQNFVPGVPLQQTGLAIPSASSGGIHQEPLLETGPAVSEEQRHGLPRWLHHRKTAQEGLVGQARVSGPKNRANNQRRGGKST